MIVKRNNMNRLIISLVFLVLIFFNFSCNDKINYENYDINLEMTFSIQEDKIREDCKILEAEIKEKKYDSNMRFDTLLNNMNSEIENYNNYLEILTERSKAQKKNIFFSESEITEEGKIFLNKSNFIYKRLNEYSSKNEFLKKRVQILFDVKDIKDENNYYYNYLDYYYNGVPQKVFNFLIMDRKRNLLIIQKEIIDGVES